MKKLNNRHLIRFIYISKQVNKIIILFLILFTSSNVQAKWVTQVLDTGGDVGIDISLKAEDNGKLHLTYNNVTNNEIRYASIEPSAVDPSAGWFIDVIDNGGSPNSLALDSNNSPYILYRNGATITRIANWDGTTWQTTTLDLPGVWEYQLISQINAESSLAFTAYQRCIEGPEFCGAGASLYSAQLFLFTQNGDTTFVVDPPGGQSGNNNAEYGKWNSLSLNPANSGEYHMVYQIIDALTSQQSVKYAMWDGISASPSFETLETSGVGNLGEAIKISIGSNGIPQVVYINNDRKVVYAWKDVAVWESYELSGTEISESVALYIDSSNNPHIAYYDRTNKKIKYAYTNSPFNNVETGWIYEDVVPDVAEPEFFVSQFIGISVANSEPVIAFYAHSKTTSPVAGQDLLISYRSLNDEDEDGIPDSYDPVPSLGDQNGNGINDGAEDSLHTVRDWLTPTNNDGTSNPATIPTTRVDVEKSFFGCGMSQNAAQPFHIGNLSELILVFIWGAFRKVIKWFNPYH